jgi:hypothetical protein
MENKMKITIYCCLLISVIFAGGCYSSPVKPPGGILFTSYKAPLTADFNHTANDRELIKTSHDQTHFLWAYLLDFAWGEVEIEEIAEKAGITNVAYVDCEVLSILGIYQQFTLNVYGYAN